MGERASQTFAVFSFILPYKFLKKMPGQKYHASFNEHDFYHVYNRSINKEMCYKSEDNYVYFLKKFAKYIAPHSNTYAYCLMPTHFHFLLQVKEGILNELMEKQFKEFLSGYSLAFNKQNDRNGSLFQKRFKRIKVDSDEYLCTLIHYIHHNPIHHGYESDFSNWKYSSYNAILSNSRTLICRKEVLDLFYGKENFIKFHAENKNYKEIEKFIKD
jgi:putative transposase